MIQWRTKMIQFEFDARDGEVRPVVEFPLEDAELTMLQLHRALIGLLQLVDRYHPELEHCLATGLINMELENQVLQPEITISHALAHAPGEDLLAALVRRQQRALN